MQKGRKAQPTKQAVDERDQSSPLAKEIRTYHLFLGILSHTL